MTATRVLLAEPDAITYAVLETCLGDDRFAVVHGPVTPDQLPAAATEHAAQVVVVGPSLSRTDLAAAVSVMLGHGTRTLVVSGTSLDEQTFTLLLAGASGFLLVDDADPASVADAVDTIASGATALHPMVVQAVLDRWRSSRAHPAGTGRPGGGDVSAADPGGSSAQPVALSLTARELDVLRGLHEGLTNRRLAARLGVAEKTVEAHKTRLFTKLGARNQAHAVRIAADRGLLQG